jgi:protein ImuB
MAALREKSFPAGSLPSEKAETRYRQSKSLWLALEVLDPRPDSPALESLAAFAQSLTSVVVFRPGEGLLLEVQGSLKYFSGLAGIKQRLVRELERRAWAYRLATAPTSLAASWLVRSKSVDVTERGALAGAIGSLPLRATAWPEHVQLALRQMGLCSIADCLRLPRGGFARRLGQARLDDLDRALGKKPDFQSAYEAPHKLCRTVDFSFETMDQAVFSEALSDIAESFVRELRQRQMQLRQVELNFMHLHREPTQTRICFVDPVHERERILNPLLARIERISLPGPAIGLSVETGILLPLVSEAPGLLFAPGTSSGLARAVPEHALVECLRGRFGMRRVHGIDWVAEYRPERAWRRRVDHSAAANGAGPACPPHGRPLWLLPQPRKKWGQTLFSEQGSDRSFDPERIESGWWDGEDVRREYHVVTGEAGQKLWLYRDCLTQEWYLHGIFG